MVKRITGIKKKKTPGTNDKNSILTKCVGYNKGP